MSKHDDDSASKIANQQLSNLLGDDARKQTTRNTRISGDGYGVNKPRKPDMFDDRGDDLRRDVDLFNKTMGRKTGAGSTRMAHDFDGDISHMGGGNVRGRVAVTDHMLLESTMRVVRPTFQTVDGEKWAVYHPHQANGVAETVYHVMLDALSKQRIRLNETQIRHLREAIIGAVKLGIVSGDFITDDGEIIPLDVVGP